VDPTTGQRHLPRVPPHLLRALEDRHDRNVAVHQDDDRHRRRRLKRWRLATLEATQVPLDRVPDQIRCRENYVALALATSDL